MGDGEGTAEGRMVIMAKGSQKPCKQEDEERMLTHTPIGQRCDRCVWGRAEACFHRKAEDKAHNGRLVVSMDYLKMAEGDEEDQGMPVLVVKVEGPSASSWTCSRTRAGICMRSKMERRI